MSSLEDREVFETESVVFECELSKPDVKSKWLKDGKEVPKHFRLIKSTDNFKQLLTIKNAELGDAGQYQCLADSASSTAVLRVKGLMIISFYFIAIYFPVSISF